MNLKGRVWNPSLTVSLCFKIVALSPTCSDSCGWGVWIHIWMARRWYAWQRWSVQRAFLIWPVTVHHKHACLAGVSPESSAPPRSKPGDGKPSKKMGQTMTIIRNSSWPWTSQSKEASWWCSWILTSAALHGKDAGWEISGRSQRICWQLWVSSLVLLSARGKTWHFGIVS